MRTIALLLLPSKIMQTFCLVFSIQSLEIILEIRTSTQPRSAVVFTPRARPSLRRTTMYLQGRSS